MAACGGCCVWGLGLLAGLCFLGEAILYSRHLGSSPLNQPHAPPSGPRPPLARTLPTTLHPSTPTPTYPPPPHTPSHQERDGKLRLAHFRRVKQLGAGDVGLVDLVQLQGTDLKFAMKTLDKWEMQERNKVARVLTEEGILSAVDHPFLATLYCTIQVGGGGCGWGWGA